MFQRVTAKYNGRYFDFPIGELDVNREQPMDVDIRTAMAQRIAMFLSAELGGEPVDHLPALAGFVVDPPQEERMNGMHSDKEVLSVRPSAEYGK